jgi:hypothetical protein
MNVIPYSYLDLREAISIEKRYTIEDAAWAKFYLAVANKKQQQRNIAFEYQQVLSNFHQLRKNAWARFNDPKIDERQRFALFHILINLNHDILDTLAVSDMIEREILESMQQDVKDMQNTLDEMKFTSESNNNGKNEQAIF